MILLFRGIRAKLWIVYPVFYVYISFVLFQSFLRLLIFQYNAHLYRYVYWTTEFIGVALGCGVVFEIYHVGLLAYPGSARMARRLLTIVFVMALTKGLAEASNNSQWWAETTTIGIERSFRTVQAFAIAALVGLFLFYSIPFGRNLRGVLLGYGLFITASVMWFTFAEAGGDRFRYFWSYLNPASYDLALCLWVVTLWSRQPQMESLTNVQLEEQYQRTAERTRQRLREARGYLGKVINR